MAFLEDLGRSNALGSVNQFLGKAMEMRQMEDQSADKAYGRAIDLEQLGIQKETAKREATKFEWENKKQKEQEAIDSIPTPLTSLVGVGWEKDPAKKHQVDEFKRLGLVTEPVPGLLMTTGKNAKAFKEHAQNNLDFTLKNSELKLVGLRDSLAQVGAAISGDKDAVKALGLKPEELAAKKAEIEKQISASVASHLAVDTKYQEQLGLAKAKRENELIKTKSGVVLQRNEQGGFDEIFTPPESSGKQDPYSDWKAQFTVENKRPPNAKETSEWHRDNGSSSSDRAEDREEKRKVKILDTSRREVERIYGYSQFLPTAQDPQLIEKVGKGKAIVEDIIENYKDYGLSKEPTPGKAAEMAKIKVDGQYNKKPAAKPVEDKKTKSIRELLFGAGTK